jgi:DNA polymerase/3'-5' exonuclease PolX
MNEVMMNDMLRFYYHELRGEDEVKYQQFLKGNARLMNIYKDYTEILDDLSSSALSPSQQILDNIMHYAKLGSLPTI